MHRARDVLVVLVVRLGGRRVERHAPRRGDRSATRLWPGQSRGSRRRRPTTNSSSMSARIATVCIPSSEGCATICGAGLGGSGAGRGSGPPGPGVGSGPGAGGPGCGPGLGGLGSGIGGGGPGSPPRLVGSSTVPLTRSPSQAAVVSLLRRVIRISPSSPRRSSTSSVSCVESAGRGVKRRRRTVERCMGVRFGQARATPARRPPIATACKTPPATSNARLRLQQSPGTAEGTDVQIKHHVACSR